MVTQTAPNGHPHFHHQVYWKHYRERVYVRPVGYAVRAVEPGPCTCLTKNYTPEGIVVFQDLCTKEMASAPVAGSDQAQAEQGPRTRRRPWYLAAPGLSKGIIGRAGLQPDIHSSKGGQSA